MRQAALATDHIGVRPMSLGGKRLLGLVSVSLRQVRIAPDAGAFGVPAEPFPV
jgi:hypothetical protein